MKKILLISLCFISTLQAFAQYEYSTRNTDVPVVGLNWGVVGGGFTSMLNNRDDIKADNRLNPQMMNFNWAAGAECIYWFQPTFGFGGQLMYWNGGASYTGEDTLLKYKFSAKTSLTYLKLPLMFYFKSYNKYKPNKRMRTNIYFGPYISVLNSSSDAGTYKNENNEEVATYKVTGSNIESGVPGSIVKGKLNGSIYNPLDVGFVFGMGIEYRLWRRTIVALSVRSDVGITNVENRKKLRFKYDGEADYSSDYNYWKGLYCKYNTATVEDAAAGWEDNRKDTKNFSVGAFLTIRKYF